MASLAAAAVAEVVTAASALPVDLRTARFQLQVGDDLDQTLLENLLYEAVSLVEEGFNVTGMERTLRTWVDYDEWFYGVPRRWGDRYLALPGRPAASITSVKVYAEDDTETTVADTEYELLTPRPSKRPILRISDDVVPDEPRRMRFMAVEWMAGWEEASDIPPELRRAFLLQLQLLYEESGSTNWVRLNQALANMKAVV